MNIKHKRHIFNFLTKNKIDKNLLSRRKWAIARITYAGNKAGFVNPVTYAIYSLERFFFISHKKRSVFSNEVCNNKLFDCHHSDKDRISFIHVCKKRILQD